MRYLLHHSDATFNATTKRWVFQLDRRMANPQSISISKCVFTAATASSYPNVIYMRSDALHILTNIKHSVELRDDDHENPTNVIAVMEETHTKGRYAMKGKGHFFPVHSHTHQRSIDIYFTDGTTVMDGVVAAGGGGGSSGAADDETIEDIGTDIKMWLDFSDTTRLLDTSYAAITTVGDEIAYIQNKSPGPATLFFTSSPSDMYWALFGDNTKGMVGDGSWESSVDNSDNNPVSTVPYTLIYMIKNAPTNLSGVIWSIQDFMENRFTTSNTMEFKINDNNNAWVSITATTFLPGSDWLVITECHDADGDGTCQYDWTFRNLATGTEYTETTAARWHDATFTLRAGTNYQISSASGHMKHMISHSIFMDNRDATDIATVKTWMLAKYGVEDDEEVVASAAEDASFFVELNIKAGNR